MSRRAALVACLIVLGAMWTTTLVRAQDPFGSASDADPARPKTAAPSDENPFGAPVKPSGKELGRPVEVPPGRAHDLTLKGEARIRSALRAPTRMEFTEMPLIDAVAFLRDYHGIEIQLDLPALEAIGVGSDTPMTRNLKDVSLEAGLRLLLDEVDLTHVVRDGVLMITSKDKAQSQLELRVYNVGEVIGHEVGAEEAARMLNELSGNEPTAAAGATGAHLQVVPFKDLLIVRASQRDHEQLAQLFAAIKEKLAD